MSLLQRSDIILYILVVSQYPHIQASIPRGVDILRLTMIKDNEHSNKLLVNSTESLRNLHHLFVSLSLNYSQCSPTHYRIIKVPLHLKIIPL